MIAGSSLRKCASYVDSSELFYVWKEQSSGFRRGVKLHTHTRRTFL